jgi:hypothetical protein
MKFDANRMAKLAGLAGQESSQMITEAGNRSMHDDNQDDVDHRVGKGQLAEDADDEEEEPSDEGHHMEEDMHAETVDEDMYMEGEHEEDEELDLDELHPALAAVGRVAASPAGREFMRGAAYSAGGAAANKALSETADVVYNIDEDMLREELQRMRQERADSLNETKVRNVVREEIIDLLKEMSEEDLNNSASWLYGDNKPTKSKKGQVAVGAFGIGFE